MLWGTVGGLASIIPVVGAPLVWVPVAIAFLLLGSYWKALILGLWGALVVGSVDNVLRPVVVGAREKQHPILIALAAIGGTYAFGPLGILLGPLVVSLAAAVLKEMQTLVSPNAIAATHPTDEGAAAPASTLAIGYLQERKQSTLGSSVLAAAMEAFRREFRRLRRPHHTARDGDGRV